MIKKGLSCGGIFFGLFGLLYKAFSVIIFVIANILVYFGLWIPFFYMLFGGGLMIWGGLDIMVASVNTNLFKFGLALSLVCAAIISVRSLLFRPIGEILNIRNSNQSHYKNKRNQPQNQHPRNNNYQGQGYANPAIEYYNNLQRRDYAPPSIYRSARDRQLIVHEFRDRFELYKVIGGKLVLIDIKYKGQNIN